MKKTKLRIGIDEAGRGPWAGPVVASALCWDPNIPPTELVSQVGDSKALTVKKREELYTSLISSSQQNQLYFGV